MKAPKVTVLMPALNAAVFLPDTLESVWQQTFSDFELLVVDDGSIDDTPEILAACHDPRLRVLRNDVRRKLSGALNLGLDEARGELIARMDADDLMQCDRLACQVAHLAQHTEIGCCGGWVRTFGKGRQKILQFPSDAEIMKAFTLFYSPFAHPTVMFRRKWFAREGLRYDGSYYPAEDYELWSRVVMRFPCNNLRRVLVDYRIHEKSMTGGEWSNMDAQTVRVQQNILMQLGIKATEEEARLHRESSMGQLLAAPESISRVETWLFKLWEANKTRNLFQQNAFSQVLNYVWFRTTMAAVRELGGTAWKLYRQSQLASMGSKATLHRWTVRFATLKAGFMARHR